jgi:inward rectifier potassium channel
MGYGNMYPIDLFTNVIAVIEITSGLLFFSLGSGLTFARYSRPTARVLFSNVAVVTTFQNVPTLMLRAANQRHNFIFEANVRCSLLRRETIDGKDIRRFYGLKLVRASTPVFALTWLIMQLTELDDRLASLPSAGPEAFLAFQTRGTLLAITQALIEHASYFDA